MKIALGCDHGGYELKQYIAGVLEKLGHTYEDFGCTSLDSCDYPDFGAAAAKAVAEGKCLQAEMTRRHNNANMMAIGAGFTGKNMAERMVEVFLSTEFEGGRHARRVEKMMALEG